MEVHVPERVAVPVTDGGRFPVRRIYCVGHNYASHAKEMGDGAARVMPFFFMKPGDAVVPTGTTVPYPPHTSDYQHEVEMVVAIGKGGSNIPADSALAHVFGYAIGLDMTRRDLQRAARAAGQPWDTGKSFDKAAPVGVITPADAAGPMREGAITLSVNGDLRQQGDLGQMIWSVGEILAELSTYYELVPGDLIFTGTPAGVGPVGRGDELVGRIAGLEDLVIRVAH